MSKYIDADALKEELQQKAFDNYTDEFWGTMQVIDEMPAADVEPVRHGKWTVQECYSDTYIICPACGFSVKIGAPHRFKWCPGCGVKMDGGSEDGNE